jgi:transcriptional regulator CtsR
MSTKLKYKAIKYECEKNHRYNNSETMIESLNDTINTQLSILEYSMIVKIVQDNPIITQKEYIEIGSHNDEMTFTKDYSTIFIHIYYQN